MENESRDSKTYLLDQIANLSVDDINNVINFIKGDLDTKEYNPQINNYLSLVSALFGRNSTYLLTGDSATTRQQLYEIYDEMDESTSYVSAALDILSDDATQPDEDGYIVKVHSSSEKVQNLVQDLFDDLEIDARIAKWARAIAKYGDLFIGVNYHEKSDAKDDYVGITSVDDTIYPSNLERKDFQGKLLAFQSVYSQNAVSDSIYPPWEFVHFRHKGELFKSQQASSNITNNDVAQYSLSSSYGQSILKPAIKVYAQLRFVENMIILSRLTNSIRRNIFLINVGTTDPKASYETIRNYANLLKKDISLDIENGIYNSQKHSITYDEDIFIPVNDPKNDVRIEQVGGDVNVGEQYDLEYLLNKLFSALKIPKAYLNYEQDLNARSTLIQLDIRYARSVSQLQNTLISGLLRLAYIHLSLNGMNPNEVELDIQLTSVSAIDEESKLEARDKRVTLAQSMWDLVSSINDKLTEEREKYQVEEEVPEDDPTTDEEPAPEEDTELDLQSRKVVLREDAQQDTDNSPIDLEYFTEKMLGEYFEFSKEDVSKLLRRKEKSEEVQEQSPVKRINDRLRVYPNSDLHSLYPIEEDKKLYESSAEKVLKSPEKLES